MRTSLLQLSSETTECLESIDIQVSFKKFVHFLEKRIAEENSIKKNFYQIVLQKFIDADVLNKHIDIRNIEQYQDLLNYVYIMLVPAVANEYETLWALNTPVSPTIFYSTPAFHDLMYDPKTGGVKKSVFASNQQINVLKQKIELIYALVLERLYNFKKIHTDDIIHSLQDEETGLLKYYKIDIDNRFIDVYAKEELPVLNLEKFREEIKETHDPVAITKILPLSKFRFEGFAVVTITDVTAYYAVESIKNIILERSTTGDEYCFNSVMQSLKTLVQNKDINFGLLPNLKVNDKLVFDDDACSHSAMNQQTDDDTFTEEAYISLAENYFKDPKIYLNSAINDEDAEKKIHLKILKHHGVESYAILPVYYNSKIAGVLEVYSTEKGMVNEETLSKLKPAIPLLAQLLQNSIDKFDAQLDNIIRDKFTAMQPAVQWKFNEVAWHYLRDLEHHKSPSVEPVFFKDVYPLYGAIDIRNSTIERNNALRADLKVQSELLIHTLECLKEELKLSIVDELIFKTKRLLNNIIDITTEIDEIKVEDFFLNEVIPFLTHFKDNDTKAATLIQPYFDATNEHSGAAYNHRRQLEDSMQTINTAIGNYLDLFKDELQRSYPCYYEKFRTDGVEYDIYIGQSIAPDKPFNHLYLKNIRLWQLTSMAAIAKMTKSLLTQIPKQLHTTQLIFIHGHTIDIGFRADEKRFDVEGTYNIRYQVIKKRIDKVHVKVSGERLTQPNKIALVYFNRKEANEYIEYIHYLQEQGILDDNIEELELEELQGVSGLQAIRVGVK